MSHIDERLLLLTANIVSARVRHHDLPASALPDLIRQVYAALSDASTERRPATNERASPPKLNGATSLESVFPDHLVCLRCGLTMKMLKRHLLTVHKMTPVQYRTTFDLPLDYPLVAENYAALRSSLAKQSGLGKRAGATRQAGQTRR